MGKLKIEFNMIAQPTKTSCGPTCLHAVYNFWGDKITIDEVLEEVKQFEDGGGTLAVILGSHALHRGYQVRLYSYNLNVFDPTWAHLPSSQLLIKLREQQKYKLGDAKFTTAVQAYISFLEHGGELRFDELSPELIRTYFEKGVPVLTGLSATYLYKSEREHPISNEYDDVRGSPVGHFVILHGHNPSTDEIYVADPEFPNPMVGEKLYYKIKTPRLMASIFLGVVTFDGNLLVITPKGHETLP